MVKITRLVGAGPGGHRSGSYRRGRDPERVARIDPGPWSRSAEDAGSNRARIASRPRCAHPQPGPAEIDCRCARRCHATALITEANAVVQEHVIEHERDDEGSVYPRLAKILTNGHGLSAMSRAHREILHLARLLARVVEDLPSEKIDRYLVRDAQRVIEAIEALVRIHTAQEEDIYDAVVAR